MDECLADVLVASTIPTDRPAEDSLAHFVFGDDAHLVPGVLLPVSQSKSTVGSVGLQRLSVLFQTNTRTMSPQRGGGVKKTWRPGFDILCSLERSLKNRI